MNQKHVEMIGRTLGSGLSRRGVLRALGVGGASGILAMVGHEAVAGERPHQRLRDRTPQRNRKQRTNRRRNNNRNTDNQANNKNNNQTNQLGSVFGLGTSVAFDNQLSVTYKVTVIGENGNVEYECPPDWNNTLSVTDDDGAVTFVIQYAGWEKNLWIQAHNPLFGAPVVGYKANGCDTGDCETTQTLGEDEGFWIDWYDNRFLVHRQPDSSDYKMFLVTAYS